MPELKYYIIGDIHGHYIKLKNLFDNISGRIKKQDLIIFLGDYIDRGPDSFNVIEFLLNISRMYNTCFLMGNHEDMLLTFYKTGKNYQNYMRNGGGATIKNYINNLGDFYLPVSHKTFFNSLKLYYEGEDFIAVHAGLNPEIKNLEEQERNDLLWIREDFYSGSRRWEKTVIFGHTPTPYLHNSSDIYFDKKRNIIGIDTFAMYENYPLSCLVWPDIAVFQGCV